MNMRQITFTIFTLFLLLSSLNVDAQTTEVAVSTEIIKDTNGKRFYHHHIHKGETLYAISKAYKVTIDSIEYYNKGITEGIKIGEELRIPIYIAQVPGPLPTPEDTIAPQGFIYHKVIKGETLYRISFNYQVKIEELKAHNPKLTSEIHAGDWILIPNKETQKLVIAKEQYDSLVDYKIGWFDNYYRLEKKFHLNKEQLEQINPQLIKDGVRRGLTIKVPCAKNDTIPNFEEVVLDSIPEQELISKTDTINHACKKIKFNRRTYKIGLMLPLFANLEKDIRVDNELMIKEIKDYKSFRFIDFYEGALLALDSLKKLGFKAELYVWDTKASVSVTDSICNLEKFKELDLVIGPLYSKNVEVVRKHIGNNAIKLVEIFSQTELPIDTNAQHFEIRSTSKFKYNEHIRYINDSLPNSKIIIIHRNRPSELSKLAIIDSTLFETQFNIDSSRVSVYVYNNNIVDILSNLEINKTNILINLIDNEAIISDFLRQLYLLKNDNEDESNYDIMVMANNIVWGKYKTLEVKYLNDLRYTYTVDYYIDYDDKDVIIPFENKYYKTYSRIPSKLGFIGHDIMWYFGNALYDHCINFSECVYQMNYHTMHNNLLFEKVKVGLFRNENTNLLQYKNYNIIKKN